MDVQTKRELDNEILKGNYNVNDLEMSLKSGRRFPNRSDTWSDAMDRFSRPSII
jgi:hypothetical protein